MARQRKPTLRDVAQRAGVSTACASLAMNGRSSISQTTTELVIKAAKEVSYVHSSRRSEGSRADFAQTHLGHVGLISIGVDLRPTPLYGMLIAAISAHLNHQRGEHLSIHTVDHPDQLVEQVEALRLDSVMLVFRSLDGSSIEPYRQLSQQLPCLQVMGQSDQMGKESMDHVTYNNAMIGPLAARWLLGQGHSNAVSLSSGQSGRQGVPYERMQGFVETFEAGGGSAQAFWFVGSDELTDRVREIVNCQSRPTAMFVNGDLLALTIYSLLRMLDVTPGQDIKIVSCNNTESLLKNLHPRPPSIDIHVEMIGRWAVEQLRRRVANRSFPRVKIAIDASLAVPELDSNHWAGDASQEKDCFSSASIL